jgi:predicted permease
MLERLKLRARALLSARSLEAELDEELRYHLEAEEARLVAHGTSPGDAALAARRAFGNPTQLKEEIRDGWGRRGLERLGQDARYAWRSFRRAPAFALTVVGTIALALGLNTMAFTIFDAYVLRPVPVRDPTSLYQIAWSDRAGKSHAFSWPEYQALRSDQSALEESFAFRFLFTRIDSAPAFGQLVTGNYFSMLGVGAALGRTLVRSDASGPGDATPIVVLSHDAWTSRFGADSSIVGKTIHIRGHALEVVGVIAPGFAGLGDVPIDFWVPLSLNDALFTGDSVFGDDAHESIAVIGRLRPGVAAGQAEAWLVSWLRARHGDAREPDRPATARLISRATGIELSPQFALFFAPIATAFVLVLLIACANVANMMLARGLARQPEIGIRLSLGAARSRVLTQLLTEALLLAVPGALAGFALSRFTIGAGVRLLFATIPTELAPYMRIVPLEPDGRVFLFMLLASLASALLFGLAPALQATRPNIVQATRGDFESGYRPSRLRNGLVIGQVTVCVLLLICAGILLRGVGRLQRVDVGMSTHGVLRLDVDEHPGARERMLAVLRAQTEVRTLAAASSPPFGGRYPVAVGRTTSNDARPLFYNFVSSAYFDLLEMPLVRGRRFSADEEREGAPVVIVSEGTARALWPGRNPIGEQLRLASESGGPGLATRRDARVVGVVPDVALGTIIDPFDAPVAYYPNAPERPGMALLARVTGEPETTMRRLDATLAQLAPAAVEDIHTLDVYMIGAVYPFRAAYWIAGALGAIALLLTVTGVYGVLSYVVAQRRKELGIRVALGAAGSAIVGLVLRSSLRLCAIGLAAGVVLALGVARLFAANIVRLGTFEPAAFVGGALLVLLSCLAAAYAPARRAGRADPMEALRAGG